jgi:hypothetical protein
MTRTRRLVPLLAACLAALALPPIAVAASEHGSSEAADAAIAESISAILQGDSARALRALAAVPAAEYRGFDAQYRACMFARLDRSTPPWLAGGIDDPFVQDVLHAYQDYWWRALARPAERAALDAALLQTLRTLLGAEAAHAHDFDAVEPLVIAALERAGYHALMGRTMPLRELMLWRTQESREFDVALPEDSHRVRAELLDDFLTLGWSAYGRCDRGSNGGWATEDALFAVMPAFKEGLDHEKFSVVFLGHETQHLADKNRFPGLEDWELEYRAKLAELALAEDVGVRRLRGFITSQGDDRDAPHPYANSRVVSDLRERLGAEPDAVPRARLQAAAVELLEEDSRRLQARTAAPAAAD